MMKISALRAAASLCLIAPALHSNAAGFKAGEWDLSIDGIVNAYYTASSCKGDQSVGGIALATQALGCGGADKSTVIGNGLLPNALIFGAKSKQDGWDVGGTILIGVAVSNSDSVNTNTNVDVRQGFLTFGRSDIGTFKVGRDAGLFGNNVIFSDMTLLGVGAPTNATQRNRVTLGHIGAGYTYLGYYGQIAYTTPTVGGLSGTIAVMSPVDAWVGSSVAAAEDTPGLQARIEYAGEGFKGWGTVKTQKFTTGTGSFNMNGVELGGSMSIAGFGLVANVQSGKGIGVVGDADSGNAKQTNVLLQGTYDVTPAVKLGVSWGQSKLKDGVGTDLRDNTNVTGGAYFKLTKSVTLVGELSRTESKAFNGAKATDSGVALGAILFF